MKHCLVITGLVVLFVIHAAIAFAAVTVKIRSGQEIRLYKDYHALVVGVGN